MRSTLTVTLAQLAAFWRDPATAWLKALQLEIKEDEADDKKKDKPKPPKEQKAAAGKDDEEG